MRVLWCPFYALCRPMHQGHKRCPDGGLSESRGWAHAALRVRHLHVCAISDDHGRRDRVCRPIGDRTTAGVELNFLFSLSMLGMIEEIDADLRRLVDGFAGKRAPAMKGVARR